MEYYLTGKGQEASEMADKVITNVLQECSRQLYGFTRSEFDSIIEYDIMNILAFYYSEMNAQQKMFILEAVQNEFNLADLEDTIENLVMFADDELYIPLSCKLMDQLGDSRVTIIVYQTLFKYSTDMVIENWDQDNSYSNYLVLMNAAYFDALANKLHVRDSCIASMEEYYGYESFDDFTESLYEKHLDDLSWDEDVDLDLLDEMISESKRNSSFEKGIKEEFFDVIEVIKNIRKEHTQVSLVKEEKDGFERIVQKTGIRERKCINIQGFECHFCEAKASDEEYVIVFQHETRIHEIIDDENAWAGFQRELYKEDIRQNTSRTVVYIVYILDNDSDNIPIQVIESNKTYGRKYVFTEDETITFINGIVKTSNEDIGSISPVQEWDRILREEHLTACLTEPYTAKKVEGYLSGSRFDADYAQEDDYSFSMKESVVPQVKWVKSLDTTGFRGFCFADKTMQFGQINLFYGANGSGKTSVLEAIEYALTAEVRRIKDFKVKLPSGMYPEISVYDREAGIHTFTPGFSKKNCKEIERVWYGVPIGRTKTTLNDNFNRFNAFDSEAAYKFIHESDNSEDSFSTMFGNLMFGETVVDHEKKWQRFKKAFNDRYTELRSELSEARSMVEYYEQSLAQKSDDSKSDEIERGIEDLRLIIQVKLPNSPFDRYPKVLEEMAIVRKYIETLLSNNFETETFATIAARIAEIKRNNLLYAKQKRKKAEQITQLTEDNGTQKQKIFAEREKQTGIRQRLERVNTDIRNWSIVQDVLGHEDTIKLAMDLVDELTEVERELYFISQIEQRTAVINFLKLDSYDTLSSSKRRQYENELEKARTQKQQLENQYNEAKKAFGEREQQAMELRKIGKMLLIDAKCPLCGHEYSSTQQLIDIIDNAVVVDDSMDVLISKIQKVARRIMDLEKMLDREKLIAKAKAELMMLKDKVPMIKKCGTDYKRLYAYLSSKVEKEKRKDEIIEQQTALDQQGFSIRNITACKEYKTTDPTYLEYMKSGTGPYTDFLQNRLQKIQMELALSESAISGFEQKIQENEQAEELLRIEIQQLDAKTEALDADVNRDNEQALENIKTKFELSDEMILGEWVKRYHAVFDKCELEVERLKSQSLVAFERKSLSEYKATIKRKTPIVERCARAVQTFEKMPSLSSFVEHGIRSNIQHISKFFKWMHHSGEFERLDIDENGIYAVRGLDNQEVRTYEMSTGQRSTIAMAVMFALHMAAPDAPQFLLLDEPLATMDDTQVLNVLDILKSMAYQNTQIFFTTANGIMIDLFKKCFKDTPFDYKEYEFIKRVNRPSEIKESSVNDTKTIEELTLEDLTLDFHQFAQIREMLRRNQEKLVAKEDWESLDANGDAEGELSDSQSCSNTENESTDNFFSILTVEERKLLLILLKDDGRSSSQLKKALSVYPTFQMMFETINEKAVDFFGETVVENDDELPWLDDEYKKELGLQYALFATISE
ncbi:MAG: AAA family ATPase [Blautia sp.]|nr:AAA family ATPase [Blautia sp.]